jgi:uridine kinase
VAIELISEHVKRQLAQRAACLREKMGRSQNVLRKQPSPLPSPEAREAELGSNVILIEQTTQLQGIYTILRNEISTRVDFIFYTDRLATLICERSMCELPFCPRTVTCPTSELMVGKELDVQVSVVQIPKTMRGPPTCPRATFLLTAYS